MKSHEEKISEIIRQLQQSQGNEAISFKKKAVSHEVPKLKDKRHSDAKIDLTSLNDILLIDQEKLICVAEPGVTFEDLVKATIKYGLVPVIVPELKTITIGGAVAGCSIESMSYKHGGFHDACLEYEVITAKGKVLTCTPENENSMVFQMVHGTFGTLGIISKLTFRLIPARPFVKVVYEKFTDLVEYKKAIWRQYTTRDADFMDGIIHSQTEYVLSLGYFTNNAPYLHKYDWLGIYYKRTASRKEDYLRTPDYFFRYDQGVTNVTPKSFIGRLLFGKFINSSNTLKFVEKFRRIIPPDQIPLTVDVFIPFSKVTEFMEWYRAKIGHFPLWCVPYKLGRKYEWISEDLLDLTNDELFLDLAIYGMKRPKDKNVYRLLEEELMRIGGIKTLISENYYSEEEFWQSWNRSNFQKVKQMTDPGNLFRDLFEKTCKAMMGV